MQDAPITEFARETAETPNPTKEIGTAWPLIMLNSKILYEISKPLEDSAVERIENGVDFR